MRSHDVSDAARLLDQASNMLEETQNIKNPVVQKAALTAARTEVERYIKLAQDHLRRA